MSSVRIDLTRDQIRRIVGDDFEAIRAFEDLFYQTTVTVPTDLVKLYIGGEVVGGTIGSIIFVDNSGEVGQDNDNLFWNDTENRLGIGTNSPFRKIDSLDSLNPQLRITQEDNLNYTDFQVNATGDLIIDTSGDNVIIDSIVDVGAISDTDYIDFNTSYSDGSQEGRLQWNSDDGTLEVGMPGGNVNLQIGQEQLIRATNDQGAIIGNGSVVYLSGATGNNPLVKLARADSSTTSSGTIAVATEDVSNNQKGFFTTFGLVRDIDTSSCSDGDILYLDASVAGGFTNVKPAQPNYAIRIGYCIRSHATEGIILVNINQRTNNIDNIKGATSGSVIFANTNGFLDEDNANLFWDDASNYLGIATNTPSEKLHVIGNVFIDTDSNKLILGAGKDMDIYYDGTDGYIRTDVVAASDLNIDCGANKTLELQTSVWMDENFDPIIGRGASAPDLINLDTTSIQIAAFDGLATTEEVSSHRELNHNYKEGTDLSFHIHWAPTTAGAGNVKWQLEYHITDGNGSTVRATGTLTVTDAASGTAWDTTLSSFGTVTGTTFKITDHVSLRLYRDPSDAADTYGSDAVVKTFGYHYEVDTLGSRQIATK